MSDLHEAGQKRHKRRKNVRQKSEKAAHQDSSWTAVSLKFTYSRSRAKKQLQTVGSPKYQADNKRNLQSVKDGFSKGS